MTALRCDCRAPQQGYHRPNAAKRGNDFNSFDFSVTCGKGERSHAQFATQKSRPRAAFRIYDPAPSHRRGKRLAPEIGRQPSPVPRRFQARRNAMAPAMDRGRVRTAWPSLPL
jgi:hypothetical protein